MTMIAAIPSKTSSSAPAHKGHGTDDTTAAAGDNSLFAMLLQGTLGVQTSAPDVGTAVHGRRGPVAQAVAKAGATAKQTAAGAPSNMNSMANTVPLQAGTAPAKLPSTSIVAGSHVTSPFRQEGSVTAKDAEGAQATVVRTRGLELAGEKSAKAAPAANEYGSPKALGLTEGSRPSAGLTNGKALVNVTTTNADKTAPSGSDVKNASPEPGVVSMTNSSTTSARAALHTVNLFAQVTPGRTSGQHATHSKGGAMASSLDSGASSSSQWAAFAPVTSASSTAPATSQTGTPSAEFGNLKSVYDIAQTLVGQSDSGNQQIQVQVHPQGMGNLLISVTQTPGGISVQMQADQMMTAQWLSSQASQLQNQLQQQGLNVSFVNVSFGNANAQSGGSEGQARRGKPVEALGAVGTRSMTGPSQTTGMTEGPRVWQSASNGSWSGSGYNAWA